MTREEAKRRAELYSALAEGKIIQVLSCKGEWIDIKTDELDYLKNYYKYRIKPEPRYRPFKSREECWNEMLKHQPFGWVIDKADNKYFDISMIYHSTEIKSETKVITVGKAHTLEEAFNNLTFTDGTPFGIKEE